MEYLLKQQGYRVEWIIEDKLRKVELWFNPETLDSKILVAPIHSSKTNPARIEVLYHKRDSNESSNI